MKASKFTEAHLASVDVCLRQDFRFSAFQRQICLLMAHFHSFLGLGAMMLLFQVKNWQTCCTGNENLAQQLSDKLQQ